jgi:predicted nucleic acid-binding protein
LSYLVDTNVFSEQAKPKPDPKVIEWLRQHESELYVSTVTIGEIRRGIERLPDGKRRAQLQLWLQSLCDCMQGRILNFNVSTAHVWGQLKASWEKSGVGVPSLDSQIAATASRHSLTLVTRNTADFVGTGIKTLNPFL